MYEVKLVKIIKKTSCAYIVAHGIRLIYSLTISHCFIIVRQNDGHGSLGVTTKLGQERRNLRTVCSNQILVCGTLIVLLLLSLVDVQSQFLHPHTFLLFCLLLVKMIGCQM